MDWYDAESELIAIGHSQADVSYALAIAKAIHRCHTIAFTDQQRDIRLRMDLERLPTDVLASYIFTHDLYTVTVSCCCKNVRRKLRSLFYINGEPRLHWIKPNRSALARVAFGVGLHEVRHRMQFTDESHYFFGPLDDIKYPILRRAVRYVRDDLRVYRGKLASSGENPTNLRLKTGPHELDACVAELLFVNMASYDDDTIRAALFARP